MLIADALLGRANESLELSIRHTQSIFFRFFLLREHVILAHYQKKRINTSCYHICSSGSCVLYSSSLSYSSSSRKMILQISRRSQDLALRKIKRIISQRVLSHQVALRRSVSGEYKASRRENTRVRCAMLHSPHFRCSDRATLLCTHFLLCFPTKNLCIFLLYWKLVLSCQDTHANSNPRDQPPLRQNLNFLASDSFFFASALRFARIACSATMSEKSSGAAAARCAAI